MESKGAILLEAGTYVGARVRQQVFDGIIASENFYEGGTISDWHFHENPHFSHILQGGSKEIRGKSPEQQLPGSSLYYYPGIAHQNMNYQSGTRIFNLEFTPAFLTKYNINIPEESWMFSSNIQWNSHLLVSIMAEHFRSDTSSSLLSVHQLCINLLSSASRPEEINPAWTRQVKEAMYDNWNRPLSLTDLAAQVALHPVTISRYFPRYFGCTLGEYLRKIKIEKSLSMIREGKQSLTEIAYDCGFADQAHFIKTCKRLTGITPKQYQKF
ncbi:helix-turn-helix domain-containing protein [Chitinophaga sp. sic0106]|uniref:helix-turn-helix domain-containing protein n=1 Tax=Chitinophaga sp. sic0106 TaxID=2854785 RepID=UPI001C488332|nr:helix-turn-helix domain-containing protein [Chitinophaga sp. sic0106]MBV7531698.1 helix-turn-helix transcriptional regulator [Chitinophaga sp. sic0106]